MRRILAAGNLIENKHQAQPLTRAYHIICLEEKHLPLAMELQDVIVQNLGASDLLHSFSYEFMKQHFGPMGVVLGVFVESRLVAFRNLYYPDPRDKEWNLGLDIGLAGAQLRHVVNLQMVCVHPIFRGNALARKMNQVALELLREWGTHYHVCATVSPDNIWNIRVLLSNGFSITKLKEKYGGKMRYVVYQDLRKRHLFNKNSAVRVSLKDLDSQKRLLSKGLYGADLIHKRQNHCKNPVDSFNLVFKTVTEEKMVPIHWNSEQEMARPLRIDYSGALYHVINRGNGGQAIFKSKRDREKFLFYL